MTAKRKNIDNKGPPSDEVKKNKLSTLQERLAELVSEPFFKDCESVKVDPDFLEYTRHPKVFLTSCDILSKTNRVKYLLTPTDKERNNKNDVSSTTTTVDYPDWCLVPRVAGEIRLSPALFDIPSTPSENPNDN